ncbi:hypothetical protein M427DRAFT_42886 [Gonapodya prolifera JEL478]|uniref:Uncharacterized protein n=1 Tax=Gonapodya prolifera (strain JEL478) TaxID=1344416 RepID=A0A139AM94_GONPJ|nr:hypothetical protein M427DRAFT_42886 [Gonapodya prolifera JEL478]|eukprot:KXS17818.1 hypothetical protein M427DRAFT_42886 [Gonapodya prolifera JEL478]
MTVADLFKKAFTADTTNTTPRHVILSAYSVHQPEPPQTPRTAPAIVTQVTIGRTRGDLVDAKYYYVSTTVSPMVTFKFRGPAPVEECVAFVVEQMGKRGVTVPKDVLDKMVVDDPMATDANVDRDVPIGGGVY